MKLRKSIIAFIALAIMGAGINSAARANTVTFTASGSGSDGPIAATASFTSGNGFLTIVLTNTLSTTVKQGQAVSALTFSVSGIGTPTAISAMSGVTLDPVVSSWTLASGTAFTNSSDPHGWTYAIGPNLTTIGGGQPDDMILPSTGSWGSGGLATQFDPYLIGPTTFKLTDASLTAGTDLTNAITSVSIGFGTSPDTILGTTSDGGGGSGPGTPLPAAAYGGLALMAGLGVLRKATRRNQA